MLQKIFSSELCEVLIACYVCLVSCYAPPSVHHYWKKKWLNNEWVCMEMAAPRWYDPFTHSLLWNCPEIDISSWHLLNVQSMMQCDASWITFCHFYTPGHFPSWSSFFSFFVLRSFTHTHSVHYAFNHLFFCEVFFEEVVIFRMDCYSRALCDRQGQKKSTTE